jgi:curved DNA-binding protein
MFGGLGGFSDFFNTLFGQGGFSAGPSYSSGRPVSRSPQRAQPMEHEVEITLEEAYTGTKRTLQFEGGRKIEASIPQGVRTGSKVRLSGQAGGADLFLKIKVQPHRNFTRKGDDLSEPVPVDIYTAILGGEVSVDTLGKPVRLTIPEGTDSGKTMRLKGLGMPKLKNPSEHGDLYARIELHLPGHLTPAEKEKFREIRNMRHA